ncbi:MAG: 1-acyl-sn-glycerol-3-phosphate acyltransferase [Deltaproteobacteria bacterium]|nr:1-acyl-sn-glycerol-3-phosphate acyltransferase [Deltaproteobacteria bacterium]
MLRRLGLILVNALFWGFFVVTSVILVVGALFLRVLTKPFDPNLRALQQYSCFWSSLYLWFNPFWSLEKRGLAGVDRRKAYVIVANHQSMADILCVFNTYLHFKWVAKKSLFKVPLLGWNMGFNGYVPIDRGNPESREKCLRRCREWLDKGSSVFFFPEGSRSHDGKLRPFKIGAFRLAVESGYDVLPIVIRNSLHAIPKHSRLLSGKSRMELEVLPPISVTPYQGQGLEAGAEALRREAEVRIAARLDENCPQVPAKTGSEQAVI